MTDEYFNLAHEAVLERYQLLPFWYTLSRHSNVTGDPIVRPVWWHFSDENYIDTDDIVLLGDSLFVAPFLDEEDKDMKIILPQKFRGDNGKVRWFDFRSLQEVKSNEFVLPFNGGKTPVYMRGGSIIPSKTRIRKSSPLMFWDPFKLTIAVDDNEKAEGEFYVDDGETFNFARLNGYVHKKIVFEIETDSNNQKIGKLYATDKLEKTENSIFAKNYDVIIEQVKITGLKNRPKSIFIQGTNDQSEKKELQFDYDNDSGIVTVHRPQLLVRENFEILFNF